MLAPEASFLNRKARRPFREAIRAGTIPVREARFRKKEKAGTVVPASPACRFLGREENLTLLFLLHRFFGLLLGGLLGFRFFGFFLGRRFLLFRRFLDRLFRRWLRRWFRSGGLFLGLLADNHQLLFLGFDDLFGFTRQFLVVLQPRQLVVVLEIVFLEIHAILPWEISGLRFERDPVGRCSGRSTLKFHPAREPLLPYSPFVVKHSAVLPASDGQSCEEAGGAGARRGTARVPRMSAIYS